MCWGGGGSGENVHAGAVAQKPSDKRARPSRLTMFPVGFAVLSYKFGAKGRRGSAMVFFHGKLVIPRDGKGTAFTLGFDSGRAMVGCGQEGCLDSLHNGIVVLRVTMDTIASV